MARVDQHFAEFRPPTGHLRAETHHQQQRAARWLAEGVVLDGNPVCSDLGHGIVSPDSAKQARNTP
jgi:hypothetical protein